MLNRNTKFIDSLYPFSPKLGESYTQLAFLVSCHLFVFKSSRVLSVCLLCHLSLIFDYLFKALHNVKYVFGIYVGGNSLVDFFYSWLGKYLKQKRISFELIDHIEPAIEWPFYEISQNGISKLYGIKGCSFMNEK